MNGVSQRVALENYYSFPNQEEMKKGMTICDHFAKSSFVYKATYIDPFVGAMKCLTLKKIIPDVIKKLAGKECSDSELDEIINGVVKRTLQRNAVNTIPEDEYAPLLNTWLRTPLKSMLVGIANKTTQIEMKTEIKDTPKAEI